MHKRGAAYKGMGVATSFFFFGKEKPKDIHPWHWMLLRCQYVRLALVSMSQSSVNSPTENVEQPLARMPQPLMQMTEQINCIFK